MAQAKPQRATVGAYRFRRYMGPLFQDGINKRDDLYEQLFATVELRDGEKRLESWYVMDVAAGITANLILTTERLVYEPFIPPKVQGGSMTTAPLSFLQRTLGPKIFDTFVIELSDFAGADVPPEPANWRAGAPLRLRTAHGVTRELWMMRRKITLAWRAAPLHAQVRDSAVERLNERVREEVR